MNLDDYVVGKKKESFCYYLENTLSDLGSIKGGPATADKKFGVYYNKNEEEYKTIQKWDANIGPKNAFKNIKIEISNLLTVGEKGDISKIKDIKISPMFKNKILTTYFPNEYISVFSETHVNYFLKKLNIDFKETQIVEEKRRLLLDYKNSIEEFKDIECYYFTAFLYWWNKPKIKDICILPIYLSKELSDITIEKLQNKLINDENYSPFSENNLKLKKETFVLFHFNNQIITSGKFIKVKNPDTKSKDSDKKTYRFDKNSIKIFEPITEEELRDIDKDFKNFSQSKQHIGSYCYESIMELIQLKSSTLIPEEITEESSNKFKEGAKKEITVNAYERNPKARKECIRIHGSKCTVCGFDFGEIYGEEFMGKIHVHHKKSLAEIDDEYEVDPKEDLVPVCPNCHMIIHSKSGQPYTIEQVKAFLKNK
ncbi:HNH endonuclease [Oceanotoga teriensis]|uniref:HNH endonuclease n=1 Tax=Oceanotoga teriensis TaxID=515440 RepID=UPI0027125958|nr:HNH endonuclease [Oceanotoga teriensis]MDO7977726.1 HNH endonuclease [Oceanotoga teriensis]